MTASPPPRPGPRLHPRGTAHLTAAVGGEPAGPLRPTPPPGRHPAATALVLGHSPAAPAPVLGLHPAAPALVLVAHGSRDPRALGTVRALLARVRELRPALAVHLGHIELTEPLLPRTLAALGDTPGILVPLLLNRGHHVDQDIPGTAAAAPARTRVAAPLGPHPLLVEVLHDRLAEAGWQPGQDEAVRRSSAVVLAAAGSRVPAAATGTRRTARLLADRLGVPVVPAYASAAAPTVPDALRALAAGGRDRVAVASYFTAPGRFATQCAQAAPWIAAAPLGAHEAMARLVLHRYDRARAREQAELTPA